MFENMQMSLQDIAGFCNSLQEYAIFHFIAARPYNYIKILQFILVYFILLQLDGGLNIRLRLKKFGVAASGGG
jgi:hypothetical protein